MDLNKLREVANIIEEETINIDAEEAQKEKNAKLEEMKQKGRRYLFSGIWFCKYDKTSRK